MRSGVSPDNYLKAMDFLRHHDLTPGRPRPHLAAAVGRDINNGR